MTVQVAPIVYSVQSVQVVVPHKVRAVHLLVRQAFLNVMALCVTRIADHAAQLAQNAQIALRLLTAV